MSSTSFKSMVYGYLNKITDETLYEKEPKDLPVVGLPNYLMDLLRIKKGIFIIEAHTGGGKSTFGKILYHLAKKRYIPYNVTYIDAAVMRREENISEDILIEKIKEAMIKPFEYDQKNKKYIMTTVNINYSDDAQKFEDLLSKVDEFGKEYLIIIDELEKVMSVELTSEAIAKWARDIRDYQNKTGKIPVKLLILLTKVLGFTVTLLKKIEDEGMDVKVITEYRNLRIDSSILENYLEELNSHFRVKGLAKNLVGEVIDEKSIKKFTALLTNLENGRYIFPLLRDAIADCIEKFLSGYSEKEKIQNFNELIKALNDTESKPIVISAENYVDKAIVAITNDRYYKISRNKKEAIKLWNEGVKGLSTLVASRIGNYNSQIISMELNHFIHQISPSSFLWLSLARVTRENTYEKTITKISKVLEQVTGKRKQAKKIVEVILLKPEKRPAAIVDPKTISGIEFRFKIHDLTNEEILALLGITGKFNLDEASSEIIIIELADTLAKMIRSSFQ
jgi:hypothetical protein